MSFESDLSDIYNKHFKKIFEELNLERTSSFAEGMGAVWSFHSKELKVQLVNDKGITDLMITGIDSEDYRDAEILINMLNLDSTEQNSLTKNERKKVLTTRNGLLEQSQLLSNNYQELVKRFNKSNIKRTFAQINELGVERSKYMFGQL